MGSELQGMGMGKPEDASISPPRSLTPGKTLQESIASKVTATANGVMQNVPPSPSPTSKSPINFNTSVLELKNPDSTDTKAYLAAAKLFSSVYEPPKGSSYVEAKKRTFSKKLKEREEEVINLEKESQGLKELDPKFNTDKLFDEIDRLIAQKEKFSILLLLNGIDIKVLKKVSPKGIYTQEVQCSKLQIRCEEVKIALLNRKLQHKQAYPDYGNPQDTVGTIQARIKESAKKLEELKEAFRELTGPTGQEMRDFEEKGR